ncbi:DUF4123 domain-containing protein [Marinobacter lutaoensis]|uniref:DUF4123 domain-containing protein n=1 Tax=Marinobacter lutaoensis TaxID=135739 RepID=UPI0015941938|nr:DUF4123 domain-containing protein [Marinobacter lutaoensis]NVD37171.1 DUF4123 domain-containing protein [Marinobacter lutaoensis]
MDAANCISTLEQRAPEGVRPQVADYALMDLACDDSFMTRLYHAMAKEAIDWWSLFEGTPLQPSWKAGPILLDLRAAPRFQTELLAWAEATPVGVFLASGQPLSEVRKVASRWLTQVAGGSGTLLRYYDPRILAPLLCVLSSEQWAGLLAPADTWHWHDGHRWRHAVGPLQAGTDGAFPTDIQADKVTRAQLDNLQHYRLAAEAQALSTYYKTVLPESESPAAWVLERFRDGVALGISGRLALERWLRLAITQGAGFYQDAPFNAIWARNDLTTLEKLTAMERESEAGNASIHSSAG